MNLEIKVVPAMTNGYQTLSPTKPLIKEIVTGQRAMERKMFNVKPKTESVIPS